ncbi:carboxymuconolactone decarboxylase family protein [Chloroflexota bacterium]
MSRVQMVQKDQAQSAVKELYNKIEENGASVLNLYRVLAHNPDVLRNFLRLGSSLITRTELAPKLRELVILRVAKLTGSEYEWAQHYPIALEVGVSREQAEAISRWSDLAKFSDEERAVLQYADEVAQNVEVQDETFRTLHHHLNEQSIVELTLSIGYWGMVARLLVPLQVDIDIQSISSVQELTGHKNKSS